MDSLYNRVLSEVGDAGIYQKKFDIVYNVLFASLWAMAYYNIFLAIAVIAHTCKLPEKPEGISELDWKSQHIPKVTSADGTEKYSDCLIYTSQGINDTEACKNFDYDTTWFDTTVVSDNNWVCDKEIYVANIYTYTKIGEVVGSIFFGWFGDVYGRKLTYIISVALLVLGRFISIVASSSVTLFTIGCIVAYFPSWFAPQSATIISVEISSEKRRTTVTKLRLVATSFGAFLLPFLYWWLRNWKSYLIITTVLLLPTLLFSWKILESPQWLLINGKTKAALRNLKHIAKINKTKINIDTETEILTASAAKPNQTEIFGAIALFSGWRLATHTLLQLFIWFTVTVNFTVSMMSSGEKSYGNPFLDAALQSLAEIPGYFIAAWLAEHIGRRYTGITSFSLTSMIWIIIGCREVSNAAWIKSESLSVILAVLNRCSITVSYYIIDLLNIELYPTCLRQSGMSLGNIVSGGASALAPYILLWFSGSYLAGVTSDKTIKMEMTWSDILSTMGRRVDARYPSIILTVTTLLGGVLSIFFLPETRNAKLPETLEDAQKFGRGEATHASVNVNSEEIEISTFSRK